MREIDAQNARRQRPVKKNNETEKNQPGGKGRIVACG
jgi:hypothetical protein